MQYLIGVDIGTSGSKAVMTDETGHIYSSGYQQYNYLTSLGNRVEQDPAVWVKGFIGAVRECVESAGKDQKRLRPWRSAAFTADPEFRLIPTIRPSETV